MKVSLMKRGKSDNPLRDAIESCGGFESLKPGSRVLIKPNLGSGAHKKTYPPFGLITTARIIEELALLLHEMGCRDISVGDGVVVSEELGSTFKTAMSFSGIDRVCRDRNLRTVDFEGCFFEQMQLEGHKVSVAKEALETDFLIDVPVLKTHGVTMVSLGMKNMKGCLKTASKKRFHQTSLETMIAALNMRLSPQLTIIDGTYALEHGPLGGPPHRMDLIISSTDVLAADMVGASVMGKEPSSVGHLVEYARMADRTLDMSSIEVVGEKIEGVARELPHYLDYEFLLEKCGTRVTFPDDISRVCSGCTLCTLVQMLFVKDNPGIRLEEVEVCAGDGAVSHPESKTVFLYGDCAIKSNKSIEGAIEVKGCPPKVSAFLPLLYKNTLENRKANVQLMSRTVKAIGTKMGIYHDVLPAWDHARSAEFDLGHFM